MEVRGATPDRSVADERSMKLIALEYHDVVTPGGWSSSGFTGPGSASYKLLTSEFDAHLDAVREVALPHTDGVLDVIARGLSRPREALLFTFDDGGVSAYREIAPRLERHGWRGHFFIATDFLGLPGFMTPAELRELSARGHVIGTHSCSHPLRMTAQSHAVLEREWKQSADVLADVLGKPTTVGSIPGGSLSRAVGAAAARAGLRALFTSEPVMRTASVDGCVLLGRFTLRRWSDATVVAALAQGRAAARVRQWTKWNAAKLAKAVGGTAYLHVRQWLMERALPKS